MKLLYIGVDALDFAEFTTDPWLDLINSGTYGKCIPEIAHTVPSWTSINTGLSVNEHRVMPFSYYPSRYGEEFHLNFTDAQCIPISTAHMVYKYIWDYLYDYGYEVGVVNFPVTYPPRVWDKGFFISGYPAVTSQEFCNQDEVLVPLGYLVDWVEIAHLHHNSPVDVVFKKLTEIEDRRMALLKANLAHNLDVLCIQFPIIDRMGHAFDHCGYSRVYEHAAILDVRIRIHNLIHMYNPEYLLIASDHGMHRGLHTFNGMYCLIGDGISKGFRQDMHNYNLMPTVLNILGVPFDYGMPSSVKVLPSKEEEDIINAMLVGLGYK